MAKTITAYGNAQVDTAVKQFGTGSCLLDGTTDYLLIDDDAALEPGAGNFTLDFWFRTTDNTIRQFFFDGGAGAANAWYSWGVDLNAILPNKKIGIWASSNGTSWDLINSDAGGNGIGATAINANQWYHFALVRNGDNWMTFLDGVKDIDITVAGTVVNKPNSKIIGDWWNGTTFLGGMKGYIDEFRYSDTARWTANFTPSAVAYSADADTELLIHCDGADESTTFTDDDTIPAVNDSYNAVALPLTAAQQTPIQNYDYQYNIAAQALSLLQKTPTYNFSYTLSSLGLTLSQHTPTYNSSYALSALGLTLAQSNPWYHWWSKEAVHSSIWVKEEVHN